MIEVKNVQKIYNIKKKNEQIALKDINFSLPSKGMFFILGKSGSGKSTLLNILALLDNPTSGEVLINGQNINKLKEKEKTNYRNKEIGFIFQDFNLFEELNVYDNIELAVNLKGLCKYQENIIDLLTKLDLKDKIYAKTKELSGGEKQRVAIARALIKNPKIILADEPTGNLDALNSEKIFTILKNISQNHLVIVVTHDEESALKYADGILEIKDGQIISTPLNNYNEEENIKLDNPLKNKNIFLFKKIKLALGLMKTSKIRLLLTSITISIALALFGISTCLLNFDVIKLHAKALVKEKENTLIISKENSNYDLLENSLFPKDINLITSKLDSKYQKESILYQNDTTFSLDSILSPIDPDFQKEYEDNAYYNYLALNAHFSYSLITSYTDDELKNLNIMGEIPSQSNEVLINEIFADFLTKYDSLYYYYNDTYQRVLNGYHKFKTMEDILNQKIYLDKDNYLIIKGIIKDENLAKFNALKPEDYGKMETENPKLYQEFKEYYQNNFSRVFVNNNFFSNLSLKKNKKIDYDLFKKTLTFDEEKLYNLQNYTTGYEVNNCYNGNNFEEKCYVNNKEIILGKEALEKLFKDEINDDLNNIITDALDAYEKELIRKEELMKETENCPEEEECPFVDIPEPIYPDIEKITQDFYLSLIQENNLIGKKITLTISDPEGVTGKENKSYELEIIGINLIDNTNYVNEDEFKEYLMPYELVTRLLVKETDEGKIINIFQTFTKMPYEVTTKFSEEFITISKIINSIQKIALYIVIGFLSFAIIMLTLFITMNIGSNKKKIGILKALGTKTSDVVKIFWLESFFISLFSFILAIILSLLGIYFTNFYITKEISFYIRPLVFNFNTLIFLILILILVNIISFIIPIRKISKLKPIDLIREK